MFSRLPATSRGLRPICSIAAASSVTAPLRARSACSSSPARNICGVCASQSCARSSVAAMRARRPRPGAPSSPCRRPAARGCRRPRRLRISSIAARRSCCGRQGRAASCTSTQSSASTRRARPPGRCTPIAPRLAAAIERLRAARRTRSSPARAKCASSGREHDEHRLHRRHANCSHRVPQHRPARERAYCLGALAPAAASRCRRRESARRVGTVGSSSNSGRYNYTLSPLMHRDSLPARRRYTRLAGSADALALARLAQAASSRSPSITATALDAQRLVDEIAVVRAASCACACCPTGKRCPTTSSRRTRTWSPSASPRSTASSAASSTSRSCRRRPRWCACARRPTSPARTFFLSRQASGSTLEQLKRAARHRRLPARHAGGGAGRILLPRRPDRPLPDGQRAALPPRPRRRRRSTRSRPSTSTRSARSTR